MSFSPNGKHLPPAATSKFSSKTKSKKTANDLNNSRLCKIPQVLFWPPTRRANCPLQARKSRKSPFDMKIRRFLALIQLLFYRFTSLETGTVNGNIRTAIGGNVSYGTLTFNLSQGAVLPGHRNHRLPAGELLHQRHGRSRRSSRSDVCSRHQCESRFRHATRGNLFHPPKKKHGSSPASGVMSSRC